MEVRLAYEVKRKAAMKTQSRKAVSMRDSRPELRFAMRCTSQDEKMPACWTDWNSLIESFEVYQ